ncbi:Spindle assembly checkpoint component MAD1 [Colletotrichum higginsianum IMI 349063]|uniref:Spindle assembly checkpoint component MAD1 n=2 Tax=Colletotrichum higginsianum TaxID=80884 RepID=A0A1B7XRS6_COLHI|nr:Spindle assembly checkpoint component MAD1 [Colletotrichum higginsianum IMI 349063]OBR02465.1 Spindle assembly checkpoint component MAD1 [Colletotrichum higginsianum IMI 349063]TID07219.1 Spindle assembly checkpoint component MAD1 [Colletotrichum higginsianum]
MDGTSDDDEWERIAEIGYLLMATQQHPTVSAPTNGPVDGPGTNRDGGQMAAEPQAQLPQYSGAGSPGRYHVTLSPAAPASGNHPNNIGPSPGGRVQEHHRHSTGVMRSHTPSGDPTGRRSSVSNRLRASIGGSALPRPNTSLRESRTFRATQPTYNLFTGGDAHSRPGSRASLAAESVRAASCESSKENMAPPDAAEYESQRHVIEELKAELGTLRYTISTFEQEKQMADARHNAELEDQRRRAQADFTAKQAAETEKSQAARQLETAQRELSELRENIAQEKTGLEKRARDAEEEARLLQEQLEDLSSAKDEAARINEKKTIDLEMQLRAAQKSTQELEQEAHAREAALQQVQSQLADKDSQVGNLESEVLRLKAQTGDADTMAIIKRELSEQVAHIRNLEATNREQLSELKHLRQIHRAVEVVEEEKRSLQRKLEAAQSLEAELSEARIQRQRLEDERIAWTGYLASTGTDLEFDSPEAVARALVEQRYETAAQLDRVGSLQAELAAQESAVKSLQEENATLKSQLTEARSVATTQNVDKTRLRTERQRVLAVKEVEYLRAQLKTFDAEDEAFQPEAVDETRTRRIQELEDLVDKYRSEVQALHAEMSSIESGRPAEPAPAAAGTKRHRDENDEALQEQLGLLSRKSRKLQDQLASVQTQHALTQKELSVAQEQLKALKTQSKTRVLSLRSNPTSDFEAIKMATLKALERENADLLAQIRGDPSSADLVPRTQLDAANRLVEEARAETASAQKSAKRLKEVWSKKSLEFKEAIFSTLGWTVMFMPNGKMRVESTFYPSRTDEYENSIVFDGEKGTMKVGGGPRSAFARRIGDQIGFWVREKGCIPGFLAALTLEFYEEHSRNQMQTE